VEVYRESVVLCAELVVELHESGPAGGRIVFVHDGEMVVRADELREFLPHDEIETRLRSHRLAHDAQERRGEHNVPDGT